MSNNAHEENMLSAATAQSDRTYEIWQRVRRIETKLVALGLKMGITLNDDDAISVNTAEKYVVLTALDVAYTSVVNAARKAGLSGKVRVYYDGEEIAVFKA